ncbi:MAG: hypothetical protein D6679_12645 [Candidatus Hydrogenedentota bacterium]|nr:MAG: hypothetical protein D6679_12645 [Candidatus Hydrogenedentota bacterium]
MSPKEVLNLKPEFCRFPEEGIHHRDTEITEDEMKKGRAPKKTADFTHSFFSFLPHTESPFFRFYATRKRRSPVFSTFLSP